VITVYNRIKAGAGDDVLPRVAVFAAKAAPGYQMAKLIIKLINSVAATINADLAVGDRLKVIFLPNFNVTLAERIYPAADLSEQISLAGKEASGTGNMKFALNGALTIGTLDGANIEIREHVGPENFFLFGLTDEEVVATRAAGYNPREYYEHDPELRQAIDQIASGVFAPDEPDIFRPIVEGLLDRDEYLLLADYRSYIEHQDEVDQAYRDRDRWTRMSILNVARCGYFSSDRSIHDYARTIWQVQPVDVAAWRQDTGQVTMPTHDGAPGIHLTDAEWAILAEGPTTIGSVMMAVADSGLIGTVLEEGAIGHAPSMAARRFAGNPLIQTVLRRTKAQSRTFRNSYRATPQRQGGASSEPPQAKRRRGFEDALELCGRIANLLEQKVPDTLAEEFKEWLLAIGDDVASAATEGGFVSIGGEAGSKGEVAALRAIRHALRIPD
jgi:hypothetical protein